MLCEKFARFWCRLFHPLKTEHVAGKIWRRRCLECGRVYFYLP